ncbi:MAG: Trk family potassium uptake protein, partial [Lachnospiraceae bacterium]|nr:Trk family potassium uptake protein [Lachnospiraceae bacterium]
MERRRARFTYTQTIAFSFFAIIFIGAIILSLPISSKSGEWTGFIDSFFTATSATCVTGLVVYDTYAHWSLFGQTIILLLIQIGGLSFMTVITMFSIFVGKTIGLHERRLLMQSAGTMRYTGVIRLIKQIVILTVMFEAIGSVLLFVRFYPELGFAKGLYYAVFHSVSAFCNAGFDLMGYRGEFSSLISFADDTFVNFTIMFLIFAGGFGFLVWTNLIKKRFRFKELDLHSKVVITVTAILIISGALLVYIFEVDNAFAH